MSWTSPSTLLSQRAQKVHSTAKLSVLRQATIQNSQVSNGIVQVCIVLVAKRARLEAQVEGLTRTDGSSDNTLGSASSVLVVIS